MPDTLTATPIDEDGYQLDVGFYPGATAYPGGSVVTTLAATVIA